MSTQSVRVRTGFTPTRQAVTTGAALHSVLLNDKQSGDTGAITFRELKNLDAANTVYMGPDNTVTTATGHPIGPGGSFELLGPSGAGYCGDVWLIAGGGTVAVSLLEF